MGCVGREGPGTSNGFPPGCPALGRSRTKQGFFFLCRRRKDRHFGHGFTQNALSAPLPCENAELLHSFLAPRLKPNTEVFSKVSQSLALVNSVSTLLNKGGIACRRPMASQDFCASAKQTQTLTATLLQSCTSRHERKRGSAVTAAGKASEHALLHGCSQASSSCFKAHPMPTQTTKACQNMPLQCSCLSMHKTVKVCEKLSSRKSFLKEVRNSTVARESLRANKRSPTSHCHKNPGSCRTCQSPVQRKRLENTGAAAG